MRKLKKIKDGTEKAALVARLKAIEQERAAFPSGDEMDGSYRRLKYIRYADDFILGVIGSKEDALRIKEDIKSFLFRKPRPRTVRRKDADNPYGINRRNFSWI